ncbi:unnamed protein product [Didymodactylos carnosus]|uniref:Uncharacterized protein n=1 Tax=Didymodactylos carnosus TaxID=1234261 RepID=A0A815F3C0_9BILA|nr:unnamed protein product [Didymodactylos carnosus]CAF1394062.1 unnamed protein product [Didymodactylos carnosus]CAF4161830.1 unnamed protein product [Didymodactylos carnosus]CAF4201587.1 unnamed protein product [Didymodactylos carnosus]
MHIGSGSERNASLPVPAPFEAVQLRPASNPSVASFPQNLKKEHVWTDDRKCGTNMISEDMNSRRITY